MWFDAATNACTDQHDADCRGVPVCDDDDAFCADAEDILATTTTTTIDPDAFKCPEENGWYADPDNCIKYYRCEGFVAITNTCKIRKLKVNSGMPKKQKNILITFLSVYCGDL